MKVNLAKLQPNLLVPLEVSSPHLTESSFVNLGGIGGAYTQAPPLKNIMLEDTILFPTIVPIGEAIPLEGSEFSLLLGFIFTHFIKISL